jgi:hypothetical protein
VQGRFRDDETVTFLLIGDDPAAAIERYLDARAAQKLAFCEAYARQTPGDHVTGRIVIEVLDPVERSLVDEITSRATRAFSAGRR